MSNNEKESPEGKNKRGISIRLDHESLAMYEACVGAAVLTVTGALRASVLSTLRAYHSLEQDGLRVICTLTRKPKGDIDPFPELLGSMIVDVTPPMGLTVEDLHRLVFVTPEFVQPSGHEPFRVDSAHHQRIVLNKREVTSASFTRNVLSYRLIEGAWRASVFDYTAGQDPDHIERQVADAVKANIAATIACFLNQQLPELRILSIREVAELNALVLPNLTAR